MDTKGDDRSDREVRNADYNKRRNREIKRKVHKKLGGKCVRCGCDIPEALEVNHKEGGGYTERISGIRLYVRILDGSRLTGDLELVCRPCNSIHYMEVIKKLPGHWKVTFTRVVNIGD